MSKNKLIYLVGGYGTYAGQDILNKLINYYSEKNIIQNDNDHPQMFFDNETQSIYTGDYTECAYEYNNLIQKLDSISKIFKKTIILGVGCNSITKIIENNSLKIKNIIFVNIVKTVSNEVKKIKNIYNNYNLYLWSTEFAYNSKLYHNYLNEFKIEKNEFQSEITSLIKYIKSKNDATEDKYNFLIDSIKDNSVLILGCTEIPIIINKLKTYSKNIKKNIIFIDCNSIYAKKIYDSYKMN
jgi:aspartate/glutamate racemase